MTYLQPFNLTDSNWVRGVSGGRSGFFVENSFTNRQSLRIGDKLFFHSAGERSIIEMNYSSNYINIFLSGDRLDPESDGFPHLILRKK